uniref:Uncharacterized protein n=1 Tax=viral metagenome TaxID=1070528 RepID=A0A6C0I2V8_9ZZZZ
MTKIIIRKKKKNKEKEGQQGQECNTVIKPSLLKSKLAVKSLKQLPEVISINNYALLLCNEYDYKVIDLNYMCTKIQREYEYKKMKTTGTKVEMKQNIYNFYNQTFHSIKIQLKFKSHLRRKMIMLRGPALKNREMCINETDFYTLDPIRDIPDAQFYSYEEMCGEKACCYGFDIASICNLILNDNGVDSVANLNHRLIWTASSNPYNRSTIPHNITRDILKIIKLDRLLNNKDKKNENKNKNKNSKNKNNNNNNNNNHNSWNETGGVNGNIVLDNSDMNHNSGGSGSGSGSGNIVITLPQDTLTPQQRHRQNVLQLFQNINSLGHYSDADWFLHLTYQQHITFLRELIDIWNYRAELSYNAREAIYPPNGNPFPQHIMGWLTHQFYSYLTMENIVSINMTIIERITVSAILESDRCLGANFVLCALTLVSIPAREALPWLYQSVMYA